MVTLYGIANCDTVKKARTWLAEQGIDYTFCDFKKTPPSAEFLTACLQQIPLDTLLNKRGTTWRKLTAEQQAKAQDKNQAIELMMAYPSVIKRPVLAVNQHISVGFGSDDYQAIFQAA